MISVFSNVYVGFFDTITSVFSIGYLGLYDTITSVVYRLHRTL
jgi:hypothetical protein